MAAGRPTKLTKEMKKQMEYLAKKGFTEVELAEALLINPSTITKWKQRNTKFFTSLKEWKADADRRVERSLFERACGYEHDEDKIFNANGEPLVVPTKKKYPPDTSAAIFWLKNRKPDQWRDKQELEHSGGITTKAVDVKNLSKDEMVKAYQDAVKS